VAKIAKNNSQKMLILHSKYSAILSKNTLIRAVFFGDFAHWEFIFTCLYIVCCDELIKQMLVNETELGESMKPYAERGVRSKSIFHNQKITYPLHNTNLSINAFSHSSARF